MLDLLEKTRVINRLLQNSEVLSYEEMADVLRDVIKSNIYIVSNDGKVLGYALLGDFECEIMLKSVLEKGLFPPSYMDKYHIP